MELRSDGAMSGERILTLNGGSSSLKFALYEVKDRSDRRSAQAARLTSGTIGRIGTEVRDHGQALERVFEKLAPFCNAECNAEADGSGSGIPGLVAIGHRVVHGGPDLHQPMLVTAAVMAELRRIQGLDPDHLPAEIAVIDAMTKRAPDVPQVACFDTAFHHTMPRVARLLPIPLAYEARGIRRYGFHGLSYEYLVEELERVAGHEAAHGRVIIAHLGAGASLAALRQGRSVDTTMAFTPNSGVPMATRSGEMDPGVLVYLMRTERLGADALDDLLSRRSGLLGMSETSPDMRDLQARASTDARAADAIAVFCYQVKKTIGALAAALGGLDTLVFSGGIGENAAGIRAQIADGLEHLGVVLDRARNEAGAPIITADVSRCTVRVIRTDEEAILVRHTLAVVRRTAGTEAT
jgi:acetate kinase